MKLADKPRVELLYLCTNIVIPLDKGQEKQALEIISGGYDLTKDYEITITEKRSKRSLDANSYFWVLVGKLGEKLNKSDSEIYRELIKDNGVFQVVPIKESLIDEWAEIWASHGTNRKVSGWVIEDIGECRNFKGYHNIKSFYGTSVYDSKQMSRMLDAIIYECKLQGIETMTNAELSRLKASWGEKA